MGKAGGQGLRGEVSPLSIPVGNQWHRTAFHDRRHNVTVSVHPGVPFSVPLSCPCTATLQPLTPCTPAPPCAPYSLLRYAS